MLKSIKIVVMLLSLFGTLHAQTPEAEFGRMIERVIYLKNDGPIDSLRIVADSADIAIDYVRSHIDDMQSDLDTTELRVQQAHALINDLRDSLRVTTARLDSVALVADLILGQHHTPSLVYPSLSAGVNVVGGVGAWELGTATTVVPVNAITVDFDIHYIIVTSASAADEYQVNFYCSALGADSLIAQIAVIEPLGAATSLSTPVMTPTCPEKARISACAASSSGGDNITLKIKYQEESQ